MANQHIKCKLCANKIMGHNIITKCTLCQGIWHKQCLPNFDPDDFNYSTDPNNGWSCPLCLIDIFPYNSIEDNLSFIQSIENPTNSSIDLDLLNSMIYDPLEANENDNQGIMSDIDPDHNFLNEIRGNIMNNCKYYQSTVPQDSLINTKDQGQSYLHLNIRSVPKTWIHLSPPYTHHK